MKTDEVTLDLNGREQRLMVNGLVGFRNGIIVENLPTEDLDDLILKVIDARPKKSHRRWSRDER